MGWVSFFSIAISFDLRQLKADLIGLQPPGIIDSSHSNRQIGPRPNADFISNVMAASLGRNRLIPNCKKYGKMARPPRVPQSSRAGQLFLDLSGIYGYAHPT
jgi:hypothetical protein